MDQNNQNSVERIGVPKAEVIDLVKNKGYDRKELAKHFGIPLSQMRKLMASDPEMKKLRPHRPKSGKVYFFTEDEGDAPVAETAAPVAQEEVTETTEDVNNGGWGE